MSEHFEENESDFSPRRVDWSLWRRIVGHLRPYPWPVTTMIVCGLILAAVEVLLPLVTAWIIDEAIGPGRASRIGMLGGIYAVMLLIFSLLVWRFITAAGTLATRVAFDLRGTCFARLQSLPFGYFDVRSTGWLVARVTSDVTKVTGLLPWFLLDIGWGAAMLVGIFVAMMLVDLQLGLAVSVIVPPMAIATWWFKRRMLESSRRIRKSNSRITASYTETIAGVRTTRMLAREEASAAEFGEISSEMRLWTIRNAVQSATYLPIVMSLGSIGVGIALWAGGIQFQNQTGLSLGMLIAFMQYAVLFSQPIQELAQRFVDLQSAQAAAERVQELIEETPTIRDSPDVAARISAETAAPTPGLAPDGGGKTIHTVTFESVGHAYVAEERVLDDVSFELRRGTSLALVGRDRERQDHHRRAAGAVVRTQRRSNPGGRRRLSPTRARLVAVAVRRGAAGPAPLLRHRFGTTCGYGRLDADDEAILGAAPQRVRAARLRERAGGRARLRSRRRRLAISRRGSASSSRWPGRSWPTLRSSSWTRRRPRWTPRPRRPFQTAVDEILRDRIAVVIAHRLSTIRRADLILVLDQGKVVERGSHERADGRREAAIERLYLDQFVNEEEARLLGVPSERA